MKALTIAPGQRDSMRLDNVDPPADGEGAILVRTLNVGICGTDHELLSGDYGWAPPERERLIIGHESLGRVEQAPPTSGFRPGDLVVGIVRRPDPLPCSNCAVGQWDMCRNGNYTERGIKQRDGFCAEWFRIEPAFAVKLDASLERTGVLLEPTSIVAKAWEQVYRIGQRTHWEPRTALVTGAGPVGLLAALLGKQRGLAVHVLDRVETGTKPALVRDLGATYHTGAIPDLGFEPDIVIECTGATSVVVDAMNHVAPGGIVCLAGVSSGGHALPLDVGMLNRTMVLENEVVVGTVNANRSHYEQAADALRKADQDWLARVITRRVPIDRWQDAFRHGDDDIKVVIDFSQ